VKRDFKDLSGQTFDLLVIGGGVVGTGIARDAAFRGLKTLLVEKEDFAYGTTSRSTRLIHGGLRYLRRLEFQLVRQDMREREVLLRIAPHLVHPLPFLIPVTRLLDRVTMALAVKLYDILAFDKSLPSCRPLSRRETLEMEPGLELEGLVGSYLYYDCQVPFAERLCIENVISATEHGATVLNHAKVVGLIKSGDAISGVRVEDSQTGETYQVMSRIVVNATGNWVDQILGMLNRHDRPLVRATRGIHLVTSGVCRNAVVLFNRADGRLFFTVPWLDYSLIGTTDTDYSDDLDKVHAEPTDVAYLLPEVRRAFPSLKAGDIFYSMAGLRALADSGGGRASNVSRAHLLVDHERKEGIGGFISILGGKLTGYRGIAQEVVDLACHKLNVKAPCTTAEIRLPGAPPVPKEKMEQAAGENGLPDKTVAHLNALYGSRLYQVLDLIKADARGSQRICSHTPDVIAQIWHAVKEESAITVSDFLLRRSAVGLVSCQGLDSVLPVAQEMTRLLGWSAAEQQRQIEAYRSTIALTQRFRTEHSM
jgi:glycerol-3-phosphate dehydrogenase